MVGADDRADWDKRGEPEFTGITQVVNGSIPESLNARRYLSSAKARPMSAEEAASPAPAPSAGSHQLTSCLKP